MNSYFFQAFAALMAERHSNMHKIKYDDGFQNHLTVGANLVGEPGIVELMELNNTQVPKKLIPFTKIRSSATKRGYVHFYLHDIYWSSILTSTDKYLDLLKEYDGVISPDPTLLIGQAKCLQEANTYLNHAVGFYLQKNGIPVIPNVRWSDESSYDFCFLGIPQKTIVSISTHGCIKSNTQKELFKNGLAEMLTRLEPSDVVVHGHMPDSVFKEFEHLTQFHRFPSEFEETHTNGGSNHGCEL